MSGTSSNSGSKQTPVAVWISQLRSKYNVRVDAAARPSRVAGRPPQLHEVAKARLWREEERRIVVLALCCVLFYMLALVWALVRMDYDLEKGQQLLDHLTGSTGGIVASLAATVSIIAVVEISRAVRSASDEQQRREQLLELFRMWESDEYTKARARGWIALRPFTLSTGPVDEVARNVRLSDAHGYDALFRIMSFFGTCRIMIEEDKLDRKAFNRRFGQMYVLWYYWCFQTLSSSDTRNVGLLHGLFLDVVEEEWICESEAAIRWRSIAYDGQLQASWFQGAIRLTAAFAAAAGVFGVSQLVSTYVVVWCILGAWSAAVCARVFGLHRYAQEFAGDLPKVIREWIESELLQGPATYPHPVRDADDTSSIKRLLELSTSAHVNRPATPDGSIS